MEKFILTRARKNEIKDIAVNALLKANIKTLPVDIRAVLSAYNIKLLPIDSVSARNSEVNMDFASDGIAIMSAKSAFVFYNPSSPEVRIRYTLACQLAHILLMHTNTEADAITDAEAAYFADEILMPLSVLDSFGCKSAEDIARKCGVSNAAAQIRMRDFARRENYKRQNGETEYDLKFLQVFFGK